jgi:hypothetical protein
MPFSILNISITYQRQHLPAHEPAIQRRTSHASPQMVLRQTSNRQRLPHQTQLHTSQRPTRRGAQANPTPGIEPIPPEYIAGPADQNALPQTDHLIQPTCPDPREARTSGTTTKPLQEQVYTAQSLSLPGEENAQHGCNCIVLRLPGCSSGHVFLRGSGGLRIGKPGGRFCIQPGEESVQRSVL